jgi:hypothetical protein
MYSGVNHRNRTPPSACRVEHFRHDTVGGPGVKLGPPMMCQTRVQSLGLALSLLSTLVLGAACASQQKAREQIQTLQQEAMVEAKNGQVMNARKRLLEAERLGGEWGLGRDPVTSRTRMALGAIYAQSFKDEKRAVAYMSEALEATPDAKLPAGMATPRARKALSLARKKAGGEGDDQKAADSSVITETASEQTPPAEPTPEQMSPQERAAREERLAREAREERLAREAEQAQQAQQAAQDAKATAKEAAQEARAEAMRAQQEKALRAREEQRAREERVRQQREDRARQERIAREERLAREAREREELLAREVRLAREERMAREERLARAKAGGKGDPLAGAGDRALSNTAPAAARPAEKEDPLTALASRATGPAPKEAPATAKEDALSILTETSSTKAASAYPEGRVDPVYCPIPLETPPEQEVVLRCAVRPDLRAGALVLHYRPAGKESFSQVAMPRSSKGWYRGVVPADATTGNMLQFFVEAKGGDKANSGSPESPNILVVKEGAVPFEEAVAKEIGGPGVGEDDSPEQLTARRQEDNPLSGVDAARSAAGGRRRPTGTFWASLGIGTGYGWQPGGKLEFRQEREIGSGVLPGGMVHFSPEVGYQLMPNLSVSLQARLQYVPEEGYGDPVGGTPANRAFSMMFRGRYTIDVLEDKLQALVTASAGGGDGFRLLVPADRTVELVRSDTVRGGPLLFGAGGGVVYNLNRRISFPAEIRTLIGFPSTAVVFDFGAGAAYTF